MGQLTTHILDTVAGIPASGVRIVLHALAPAAAPVLLNSLTTGRDGRCAVPLLAGTAFIVGHYSLTVHLAEYFRARGVTLPEPAFIEEAVIRIGIAHADQHYHVPVLASPWSYSVYRGG